MSRSRFAALDRFILGQPRAIPALQTALEAEQVFPSLVFHGPVGTGKLATALLLSRALLCTAPEGRPCGTCRSCRRVGERTLVHPDVRLVLPEKKADFDRSETEGGAAGLAPQEQQADAIANPVWSVLIDRVRQGIAFLQRRPSESERSILIVDQAHRMEAPAANALLKTLEEPPPHAVLILNTPSWHALLPTIRSRCRGVPFQLVSRTTIVNFLVESRELPAEEAVLRAGLSDGRIGRALDLDLEEFRHRRESLVAILEDLDRRGDPGIAVARAESALQSGHPIEDDLDILMTLLRDVLILGVAPADEARLINVDIAARLRHLATRIGDRSGAALEELETTIESIRHKGNRQLLLENFLIGLLPDAARSAPDAAARA